MFIGTVRQQAPALLQLRNNFVVGPEDVLALEDRCPGQVHAVPPHWVVHLKVVHLANGKILQAVRRRCVHATGTGVGGHMITHHQGHGIAAKRRAHHEPVHDTTRGSGDNFSGLAAKALCTGISERLGYNQQAMLMAYQDIIQIGTQADSPISCQGPWGSCPDHHRNRFI